MSLRVWLPLNGSLENQGLDNDINFPNSPTFIEDGKIGKYSLAGFTGWFAVPSMAGKKQISFTYWVKINTTTSTDWLDTLSWYSTNGSTNFRSRQEFYYMTDEVSGKTGVWYQGGSIGGDTIEIGKWYHFAFTIDYDTGESQFYINGELKYTKTNVDTTHYIKGTGNAFFLRESSLDSHINDFRLYDHILSPQEVKKISQGLILHYPLNRRGFGQENLLLNSKDEKVGKSNVAQWFRWDIKEDAVPLTTNKIYTLSFDAKMSIASDVFYIGWALSDSTKEILQQGVQVSTEYHRYTFSKQTSQTNINTILISNYKGYGRGNGNNTTGTLSIKNIKLEEGSIPTPWCPNSSDTLADTLELNGNIQYDASGYKRNGQQFNLTYDSDTPKYNVSTVFTSANHSLIKIPRNTFVIQGSEAMTWSVWAYMEDWSTYNARIYSCTESGGVNIQLSSNNLTWSIRAYTNEEKTTSSYISSLYTSIARTAISSGWHLFTWTYTTEGTKLYIDGQLHMQKEGVSYGIFFNATAPLIIGAEATGSNYSSPYFEGKMSDFRIYATALSAEDVLSLYQNEAIIESDGTIRGKIR